MRTARHMMDFLDGRVLRSKAEEKEALSKKQSKIKHKSCFKIQKALNTV